MIPGEKDGLHSPGANLEYLAACRPGTLRTRPGPDPPVIGARDLQPGRRGGHGARRGQSRTSHHDQAGVIERARYTSWIRFSSCTPSFIGRWNALRPEISPVPPARLLITAV